MSAYRVNYTPEPSAKRTGRRPLIARASILVALALAAWLLVAVFTHAGNAPVATPVRTPDVLVMSLEPLDRQQHLAEIRAEAFHAGYHSAAQAGCRPALALPIAQVQP